MLTCDTQSCMVWTRIRNETNTEYITWYLQVLLYRHLIYGTERCGCGQTCREGIKICACAKMRITLVEEAGSCDPVPVLEIGWWGGEGLNKRRLLQRTAHLSVRKILMAALRQLTCHIPWPACVFICFKITRLELTLRTCPPQRECPFCLSSTFWPVPPLQDFFLLHKTCHLISPYLSLLCKTFSFSTRLVT
jgi:hypothetical protein